MREHQGSVSSHPNEGENIPRHSRLENKNGNEGQGARYKKTSCIVGNSRISEETIMGFSIY